jgi:hypothetical protein
MSRGTEYWKILTLGKDNRQVIEEYLNLREKKITGGWRKSYTEELRNFYSPNTMIN